MSPREALEIGVAGFIVGFLIRLGVPSTGEMILIVWGAISSFLIYILAIDQHFFITIASIIIIPIAVFLIFRPIINAIVFGIEGIVSFIIGFLIGFFVAAGLIGLINPIF
jgi:hypothetical protein